MWSDWENCCKLFDGAYLENSFCFIGGRSSSWIGGDRSSRGKIWKWDQGRENPRNTRHRTHHKWKQYTRVAESRNTCRWRNSPRREPRIGQNWHRASAWTRAVACQRSFSTRNHNWRDWSTKGRRKSTRWNSCWIYWNCSSCWNSCPKRGLCWTNAFDRVHASTTSRKPSPLFSGVFCSHHYGTRLDRCFAS